MTTRTREAVTEIEDPETQLDRGISAIGTLTAAIRRGMPDELDGAGEALTEALRTVSASVESAPDDNVLVGASLAAGVAIGLLVGGGPRLIAAGAVVTAVSLGAALLGRRPRRYPARLATPAN